MADAQNKNYLIMLSGFESDTEKSQMAKMIQRLGGTYCYDRTNSQAYVSSCTHVVCRKPSRSEKFLAACAAGKWILNHHFIEDSLKKKQWVAENNYEWGMNVSARYPSDLQRAPKRWREKIARKRHELPFSGWKVGLVMKRSLVMAYARILEAGGGEAVDVTSEYSPGVSPTTEEEHTQSLLTHVLVAPTFIRRMTKSKTEDIPHLRAEFLAMYLLLDPPPDHEQYSFHKIDASDQSNEDSQTKERTLHSTLLKRPKDSEAEFESPAKSMMSPNVSSSSHENPTRAATSSTQSSSTNPRKDVATSNKPLPASVFAKSAVVFPATKTPKGDASPTPVRPQFNRKSPFTALGAPQTVKISGPKPSSANVKDKSLLSTDKSPKKLQSPGGIPTISLGPKRSVQDSGPSERQTSAAGSAKTPRRHFSEDFFRRNHVILEEFALRKKQMLTSYGVLEDLINTDNEIDFSALYKNRSARPFSREVMGELEAGLECKYRSEHFLKEVSNRLSSSVFPPPELIFVIMKVILLDSTDRNLSDLAHNLLDQILSLHPPQAPDIKAEKLYHKALSVTIAPDTDETSPLMVAVGEMLSRYNAEDWRFWCSRDPTLGPLWTFYSRVFNIAIKPASQVYDERGVKQEMHSEEKIQNAGLLAEFLTTLVVRDYQEVLLRRNYPAHSPMIKCLLADLLWPTMTGLEPWFRRPSANLADLISLYVKAVEVYLFHMSADVPDEESVGSETSDASFYDPLDGSRRVLEELARLVSVTTSWCIHCDLRDKERGKRTSSRTLESELVSVLRTELENKTVELLEEALERLPARLKLKVNVALIQLSCSNALVRDKASKNVDELSLEIITSIYMQMMPSLLQGEENDSNMLGDATSSTDKADDPQRTMGKANPNRASGEKINRRNHKGETPLHVACMNNRPDTVRRLLNQPGIDPNTTDYAGWTALSEACNHGSIECVRALLTLPVKSEVQEEPSSEHSKLPSLEIDLTLCPMEGQTPLHDALGNDHLEIACLLIRKGGVELLDKVDSEGRTPLDYCVTEAARSSMIEYACKIAVKARRRRLKAAGEHSNQELMTLARTEIYDRILPRKTVVFSDSWRGRVRCLHQTIVLLLYNYITSGDLVNACLSLDSEKEEDASGANVNTSSPRSDVTKIGDVTRRSGRKNSGFDVPRTTGFSGADLERYANDVMYCLRWKECWDTYSMHIGRLLGDNEEAIADIMGDSASPIPTDIITSLSER